MGAQFGFDTAKNEPFNFHNFQTLAASRDLIFTERSSPHVSAAELAAPPWFSCRSRSAFGFAACRSLQDSSGAAPRGRKKKIECLRLEQLSVFFFAYSQLPPSTTVR